MLLIRLSLRLFALVCLLTGAAYVLACVTNAQQRAERDYQPDLRRALTTRTAPTDKATAAPRPDGYAPQRNPAALKQRPARTNDAQPKRPPAHPARLQGRTDAATLAASAHGVSPALITDRITLGTPLRRVLHTAQLSTTSSAGTDEQYADASGDGRADQRATFDTGGGSFDIAVGRTGTRYEVFSALDDRGTPAPSDDRPIGVLVTAFDTNGDFIRDASATYDLHRDFSLPSAVAVVAGTARDGREFVCVSSSGFIDRDDPTNPDNEPSAGVVLLVRDAATGGFDNTRSRTLVSVGSNLLSEANTLALLPNNDLLIADFDSDELRVVRDTNGDGLPDTLATTPYYAYRFSNDAPLDIAVNSRGVVFSHSVGNNTVLLALYDTDGDGRPDTDEVVVEGLSIDNNLVLHGLTVDREGTVYLIEDATGASDTMASGGNGGVPAIDAFPDPALNGFLRDGTLYATADNPTAQALTGLSFGQDATLPSVAHLALTNSASRRGDATRDGLGTIIGTGLTLGRTGATAADANARGVRVTIEGRSAPVHSFADGELHIYVPNEVGTGVRSVVVSVDGIVTAAEDVNITSANPGLFTTNGTGGGEAIALLSSGMRFTGGPFPARFGDQPAVVALFGTGWRNSLPLTVTVGGQPATVEFAGADENFPGLDQLNVRLPNGLSSGAQALVLRAA
ncbi:MAG TPA: IPT/TIG domain-containing protein, partial [Pyrinomonadaceae bacterium]